MNTRVLIVDDNVNNRHMMRLSLEADSFKTVEVANGQEALKVLEKQSVDCIISDILMPVMDGYRLCYEVRNNHKFRAIPFILCTETLDQTAKNSAIGFGADRFVNKPAEIAGIAAITREVMGQRRTPRGPVSPPTELQVTKEYSQVLIEKLEQRNFELEKQTQEQLRLNAEIQEFNRSAVGREQKMIELKRQVNELSKELGRTPPYDLSMFEEKGRD